MSMKTLYAAATVLALATPAMAQDTNPWDLHDRNAYVLDTQRQDVVEADQSEGLGG